jgi:hypothetical protein
MSMLLIVGGLVIGAIVVVLIMGGAQLDEIQRQADWDQPNPRGGLR